MYKCVYKMYVSLVPFRRPLIARSHAAGGNNAAATADLGFGLALVPRTGR